jgi:DNA-binding transcriptional ArsR family regulator
MVTQQRPRASGAFGAIADPTRRAILDLLRTQDLRAGDLAKRFDVSRPAIAKHVCVLRRAGLLRETRAAQARIYSLDPGALAEVDQWLAPYRLFWAARLMDLKHVVEAEEQRRKSRGRAEP